VVVQGSLDVRVPHEALKDVRGNLRGVTAVSTPQRTSARRGISPQLSL
jgi:hypothetical protein